MPVMKKGLLPMVTMDPEILAKSALASVLPPMINTNISIAALATVLTIMHRLLGCGSCIIDYIVLDQSEIRSRYAGMSISGSVENISMAPLVDRSVGNDSRVSGHDGIRPSGPALTKVLHADFRDRALRL